MYLTEEEKSKYKSFEFSLIDELILNGGKLEEKEFASLVIRYDINEVNKLINYLIDERIIDIHKDDYKILFSMSKESLRDYVKTNFIKEYNDFVTLMLQEKVSKSEIENFVALQFKNKLRKMKLEHGTISSQDLKQGISEMLTKWEFINFKNNMKKEKDNKSPIIDNIDKANYESLKLIIPEEFYKRANNIDGVELVKLLSSLGYTNPKKMISLINSDQDFDVKRSNTSVVFSLDSDMMFNYIRFAYQDEYNRFVSRLTTANFKKEIIDLYIKKRISEIFKIISGYKNNQSVAEKVKENIRNIFSEDNRFVTEYADLMKMPVGIADPRDLESVLYRRTRQSKYKI